MDKKDPNKDAPKHNIAFPNPMLNAFPPKNSFLPIFGHPTNTFLPFGQPINFSLPFIPLTTGINIGAPPPFSQSPFSSGSNLLLKSNLVNPQNQAHHLQHQQSHHLNGLPGGCMNNGGGLNLGIKKEEKNKENVKMEAMDESDESDIDPMSIDDPNKYPQDERGNLLLPIQVFDGEQVCLILKEKINIPKNQWIKRISSGKAIVMIVDETNPLILSLPQYLPLPNSIEILVSYMLNYIGVSLPVCSIPNDPPIPIENSLPSQFDLEFYSWSCELLNILQNSLPKTLYLLSNHPITQISIRYLGIRYIVRSLFFYFFFFCHNFIFLKNIFSSFINIPFSFLSLPPCLCFSLLLLSSLPFPLLYYFSNFHISQYPLFFSVFTIFACNVLRKSNLFLFIKLESMNWLITYEESESKNQSNVQINALSTIIQSCEVINGLLAQELKIFSKKFEKTINQANGNPNQNLTFEWIKAFCNVEDSSRLISFLIQMISLVHKNFYFSQTLLFDMTDPGDSEVLSYWECLYGVATLFFHMCFVDHFIQLLIQHSECEHLLTAIHSILVVCCFFSFFMFSSTLSPSLSFRLFSWIASLLLFHILFYDFVFLSIVLIRNLGERS